MLDTDTGTYYCVMESGKYEKHVIGIFAVAVLSKEPQIITDVGTTFVLDCQEKYISEYLSNTTKTFITW